MKIHKKELSKDVTVYYFTKNNKECLLIRFDKSMSFGKNSTSGTYIDKLEINYNNSFIKKDLIEIKLSDVPEVIVDILKYLK